MIIDIQPKSELLKKHISGFNMFEKRKDFNLDFFAFPQFGATLELYENTQISRAGSQIKLSPCNATENNKNRYAIEIFGKYTEPVFFTYEGYVDGFTVNFNPLGINYFFDKPYKKIAPAYFQAFSDLKWYKFAEELFAIKDFKNRIEFAEIFFEAIFNNIDLTDIEKAVETIIINPAINIDALADLCCMSTRNLFRKFNKYVGCSPAVYKRIARFRKSIDFNNWKEQSLNYTEICYDNNFFDTSHFRKEFLKLTHQNPTAFFKTISEVGNHKFPYRLM